MKKNKSIITILIILCLNLLFLARSFTAVIATEKHNQKSQPRLNFKNANVSGNDLSARDLSGVSFENAQMVKTNLSGSILRNSNFKNANLKNADLRFTDLSGADFTGADLRGADFRGAKIKGTILKNVNLTNARFSTQYSSEGPEFMLGLNLSFGMSRNVYRVYASDPDSSIVHGFSSQAACRGAYFFSDNLGVMFELGYNFVNFKEESNGAYEKHQIHYLFMSIAPMLRLKNVYFFLGPYIGIPLFAEFKDNFGRYDDITGDYTIPDIGFTMGAGYMFQLTHKMYLYAGINVKYEISAFKQTSSNKNRYLSIYVDVSLLFDL